MKIYREINQGSLDWLELRWGKIGGTASKGLHTKGDTLFLDVLSQHLEEFEPDEIFETAAMKRGKDLEPFAIQYLEGYTGYKFAQFAWLQSERNKLLGISPDGLTEDLKVACETKCFGRKKHTEILATDEIPAENIHQLIHYFTINDKLEKLYFCAFRPESVKSFVKEINRKTEFNLGTKARPLIYTVQQAVDKSFELADVMLKRINQTTESLKF